jgi:hypothetical protein
MRALRKTTTRHRDDTGTHAAGASCTRPGPTGRSPSNVPEVSQVLSSRKQILWILWHPSTNNCAPDGDAPRAGACGAPEARRATTASTGGPARASPSAAPRGSAPSSAAAGGSAATTYRPARASPAAAPRGSTPSSAAAGGSSTSTCRPARASPAAAPRGSTPAAAGGQAGSAPHAKHP